jgi:hypothetical protein
MPTLEEIADPTKLLDFAKDVAAAIGKDDTNIPSGLNGGVELSEKGFRALIECANKPTDEGRAKRMNQFDL